MSEAMTWSEVAGRLAEARSYWLVTASARAVPHASPVWGVVVGQRLHLYSERSTVKARDLAGNPEAVVHLESAEDVLIVQGTLSDLGAPADHDDVIAALREKYVAPQDVPYLPGEDPSFDVLYGLEPRRAMAWRLDDWDASQRRWTGD
jgi:hypothetical protein